MSHSGQQGKSSRRRRHKADGGKGEHYQQLQGGIASRGMHVAKRRAEVGALAFSLKSRLSTTGEVNKARRLGGSTFLGNPSRGHMALDAEMYKTINIELTAAAVSSDGLLFSLLQNIVTGDGDGQRTGDMIDLRRVVLRWGASLGTIGTTAANTDYRVILLWSARTGMGISEIVKVAGTFYAASSPLNEDMLRFSRVLYDSYEHLDVYHPIRVGHKDAKMNIPCLFEQTGAPAYGELYVLMLSGEASGGTATWIPAGYGNVQIQYTDV